MGVMLKLTIVLLLLTGGVFAFGQSNSVPIAKDQINKVDYVFNPIISHAQEPAPVPADTVIIKKNPFDNIPSIDALMEMYNYWYGLAIALLGYFSYLIPGINSWKNIGARVLAIGFVVGALFMSFGFADIWQVLLSFLATTVGYDKLLSVFIKSPK